MDMKFVAPHDGSPGRCHELPGPWTNQALCQGLTDVFFGPVAERPERRVEREALAQSYCMVCPVTEQCKQFARDNNEHGFWGGENEVERAIAGFTPRSPSRRAVIMARQPSGGDPSGGEPSEQPSGGDPSRGRPGIRGACSVGAQASG